MQITEIREPALPGAAAIATNEDHRMAMAFSLAACGPEPVEILDPGCVGKTFPTFFQVLRSLSNGKTHGGGGEARSGHG